MLLGTNHHRYRSISKGFIFEITGTKWIVEGTQMASLLI